MTFAELMSSRRLFALTMQVKAEEEAAIAAAQLAQQSAEWFAEARSSGGIDV